MAKNSKITKKEVKLRVFGYLIAVLGQSEGQGAEVIIFLDVVYKLLKVENGDHKEVLLSGEDQILLDLAQVEDEDRVQLSLGVQTYHLAVEHKSLLVDVHEDVLGWAHLFDHFELL